MWKKVESCGRLEKEVTGPDMAGEDQRDLGFDSYYLDPKGCKEVSP